jgi:hypothetical protein
MGLFGKQTAAYFKSIAYRTTVTNNVFFNSPRSLVNYNDAFRGGDLLADNVMWGAVKETMDHASFNSWDRQSWYGMQIFGSAWGLTRGMLLGCTPLVGWFEVSNSNSNRCCVIQRRLHHHEYPCSYQCHHKSWRNTEGFGRMHQVWYM